VFACSTGAPVDPDRLRETLQHVLQEQLHIVLPPREDGLHLLRHTSGSLIYQLQGPKEAQEALGHGDVQTTLRVYAHTREGSAAEVLRDVFGGFDRPLAPTLAPEFAN